MLGYEWGTNMISGDDPDSSSSDQHHHHRQDQFYDHHYSDSTQLGLPNPYPTQTHFPIPDPMGVWPYHAPMLQSDPGQDLARIGLNLGGRTYFSSAQSQFVDRLYARSRLVEASSASRLANVPRCQVEGCGADLTHVKHYHRRHKVCESHSKAAAVVAAGLTQRFCQQCSRFHLLTEFDNGKRSCRKRLADHNRRRRKSNSQQKSARSNNEIALTHSPNSDSIPRSPQDSGTHSTSSVTLAISPPQISLDFYRQGSY